MTQKFTVTFNTVESYRKCKADVLSGGGTISNDFGEKLLGFTADMPDALVQLIRSSGLADNGIRDFDADSVVTIQ